MGNGGRNIRYIIQIKARMFCFYSFVSSFRFFILSLISVKITGRKNIKIALPIKCQNKFIFMSKQYFDISKATPTKIDNAEINIIAFAASLLAYFQYSSLIDDIFVLCRTRAKQPLVWLQIFS